MFNDEFDNQSLQIGRRKIGEFEKSKSDWDRYRDEEIRREQQRSSEWNKNKSIEREGIIRGEEALREGYDPEDTEEYGRYRPRGLRRLGGRVINLELEKINKDPFKFEYKPYQEVIINIFGKKEGLVEQFKPGGPLPYEKEDEYKERMKHLKEQETKYQIYKFASFVQNSFKLSPFGGKYRAIGRLIAETEKWITGRRVYEK